MKKQEREVIEKARSWVWHQTEGSKHYTSAPDKVTSQNKARRELIASVGALTVAEWRQNLGTAEDDNDKRI